MASEQLLHEEMLSDSTASASALSSVSPMDDDDSTGALERAAQLGVTMHYAEEEEDDEEEEEEEEDEDAEGDVDYEHQGYGSDGAEDEDEEMDDTAEASASRRRPRARGGDEDEEDEEDEHDDEHDGEHDDEMADDEFLSEDAEGDDELHVHHHEDDEEGVGAVKIRPGETDDEDEDDSEASQAASESSDDEWDEAAEAIDDDEEEEEEEEVESDHDLDDHDDRDHDDHDHDDELDEDHAEPTQCLYCQAEDPPATSTNHDIVDCVVCGKIAHQECADTRLNPCSDNECKAHETGDSMDIDAASQATATMGTPAALASLKVTPYTSPAVHDGTPNAGSVAGEQTDSASRSLRKRRTSPIGSVDSGMSLRKRRKNAGEDLAIDGFTDIRDTPPSSSARALRIKPPPPQPSRVEVVKKTRSSLVLKIKVRPKDLRRITVKKRKYTKRGTAVPKIGKREQKRLDKLAAENALLLAMGDGALGLPDTSLTSLASLTNLANLTSLTNLPSLPVMPSATAYTQPFYSFFDKDTEDQKGKPYGGILTEAEADTSKTFPGPDDRRRFDEAKEAAEQGWRSRLEAMQDEDEAAGTAPKRKKSSAGPASQIECIEFGGWEIGTWYAAPYPEEYSCNRVLYICEFCLKYMNSDYVAWRHKLKCPAKHPPGDEIYRHGSISFFEVDGRKNPVYCQNLCLLAKLFLGSKTLYYDVEPFLFYVLCEYDEFGYHFVGYFSKEKRVSSQNNVSCILTLPIHQRKGYGNLLIDFSYLLTRVEAKTGSPEKPLSDMGLVSYRNYWRLVMCQYLLKALADTQPGQKLGLSIKKMSDDTGMTADDVIAALEGLRCLVRDPQTELYAFRVDVEYCREYVAKWEAKQYVTLHPAALTWTPYVVGRGNATNFELGPALTAIAPRDDDKEDNEKKDDVDMADGSDPPALQPVDGNAGPALATNGDVKMEGDTSTSTTTADAAVSQGPAVDTKNDKRNDWAAAYDGIPPTRFAVFPTVSTRRLNYARATIGRTPAVRTAGARSSSRYTGRAGTGSSHRGAGASPGTALATPALSRPKAAAASSKKKKTGGTGRGPGRWPKGTKKSDYGNADSGPGLPPGWLAAQAAAAAAATGDDAAKTVEPKKSAKKAEAEDDDVPAATITSDLPATDADADADADADIDAEGEDDPDTVPVPVHTPSRPADKKGVPNGVSLASGSRGRASPRRGLRAGKQGDDTVMADAV